MKLILTRLLEQECRETEIPLKTENKLKTAMTVEMRLPQHDKPESTIENIMYLE